MGRRRQKNTLDRVFRDVFEQRGYIYAASYQPGIRVYDFPSKGKVVRIKGRLSGDVHHLLSQHEKYFFLCLNYDMSVTKIWEQVFLELEDTLLIAAELKIKHPYADRLPARMTTDICYIKDGIMHAVAIKTTKDLESERTREKLTIEGVYWARKGIDWRIMTEKEISRSHAKNLQWLFNGAEIEELIPDETFRLNLIKSFLELYQDYSIPFSEIISHIESRCRLVPGTVLQLYKHLIRTEQISINLMEPINLDEPRELAATVCGLKI